LWKPNALLHVICWSLSWNVGFQIMRCWILLGLFIHNIGHNQIVSPLLQFIRAYQMTLLYTQETWYIWLIGLWATFNWNFGFINISFQANHEKSSFQDMEKLRNENTITKLCINSPQIVCWLLVYLSSWNLFKWSLSKSLVVLRMWEPFPCWWSQSSSFEINSQGI
jgi:hypothetical protein